MLVELKKECDDLEESRQELIRIRDVIPKEYHRGEKDLKTILGNLMYISESKTADISSLQAHL